ncbi:glycosyltransferase family 8 protein [Pseudoroseicyclus aestuarii]|nr:glycosyltransferase family 8 protein [Pseudoroseicyclus aestuarii]
MTADRPARHRRAIAFCADANYLPYALFAAAQIAALSPGRDFDICLCSDAELSLPPALAPLGLRAVTIDTGGAFDGLRLDRRRTASAYLRLALPQALRADYDRILYLDGDIFVQGGDFGALLGLDIGPHAVAAVRDNQQWRTPRRLPEQFRRMGWKTAPYFNSGVMLIDTARWLEADLGTRAVAFGRQHKDRLIGHDQTLLNCLLRGDWAEISPVWNWQYTQRTRLFEAMRMPHVVHFIGATKPWKDPQGALSPRFAAAMAAFFSGAMPDQPRPAVGTGPLLDRGRLGKMCLRHAMAVPATARYLSQFPTDLTVLRRAEPGPAAGADLSLPA